MRIQRLSKPGHFKLRNSDPIGFQIYACSYFTLTQMIRDGEPVGYRRQWPFHHWIPYGLAWRGDHILAVNADLMPLGCCDVEGMQSLASQFEIAKDLLNCPTSVIVQTQQGPMAPLFTANTQPWSSKSNLKNYLFRLEKTFIWKSH